MEELSEYQRDILKGQLKAKMNTNGLLHIYELLVDVGCTDDEINNILFVKWCEPHRYYHNLGHLKDILSLIQNAEDTKPEVKNYPEVVKLLKIIAVFHDVEYEIGIDVDNEKASADFMQEVCRNLKLEQLNVVYNAILDTKDHTKEPSSEISKIFLDYDLHGLLYGSLSKKIEDEKKVFKEYGAVDYAMYKKGRAEILRKFLPHINKISQNSHMEEYIDWFENRQINIAVFPGSFFPFHQGHYDILKKAEQVFDKVILAFGINSAKSHDTGERIKYVQKIMKQMPNYQIEAFDGMLTDYIKAKPYPVTVVKGLRNITDFDYEKVQLRFMEDMDPEIKIMYIICDRAYEHISSSGIRQLQKYDVPSGNQLLKNYIPFHE